MFIVDIHLKDGTTITFNDFFKIDCELTALSDDFTFGCVCSSSLTFSIWDSAGVYPDNYSRAEVKLYEDTRLHQIGTFLVDHTTRKENILEFHCLDALAIRFEKTFNNTFTSTFTLRTLAEECCSQAGVRLAAGDFTYQNTRFDGNVEVLDGQSLRQLVGSIAIMSGNYAHINNEGRLEFKFFDNNARKTINYENLQDFDRENSVINISEINILSNGTSYVVGEPSGYTMLLSEDKLFNAYHQDEDREETYKNAVMNNLFRKVDWFEYLPCNIKIHYRSDIKLGDTILVEDKDGFKYKAIVSNIKYSNMETMEITSQSPNRNRQSELFQEMAAEMEQEKYFYTITSENIEELTLNTNEEIMINELAPSGLGKSTSICCLYTLNILSNIDSDVHVKLYVNNEVLKDFIFHMNVGYNMFNVCEEITSELLDEIQTYRIKIDMSEYEGNYEFKIEEAMSTFTLLILNAKTRKQKPILEFHENLRVLSNIWNNFFNSNKHKNLIDNIDIQKTRRV